MEGVVVATALAFSGVVTGGIVVLVVVVLVVLDDKGGGGCTPGSAEIPGVPLLLILSRGRFFDAKERMIPSLSFSERLALLFNSSGEETAFGLWTVKSYWYYYCCSWLCSLLPLLVFWEW
jgi:hypothetical protein